MEKPLETWNIGDRKYEIWSRAYSQELYAIKYLKKDCEGLWMHSPQEEYETLGGCYEAILLHLQRVTK